MIIEGMFVDQHGNHTGEHPGQHEVKYQVMPVGHFQYNDGRSKGGSCNACQEAHHSGKDEQVRV